MKHELIVVKNVESDVVMVCIDKMLTVADKNAIAALSPAIVAMFKADIPLRLRFDSETQTLSAQLIEQSTLRQKADDVLLDTPMGARPSGKRFRL